MNQDDTNTKAGGSPLDGTGRPCDLPCDKFGSDRPMLANDRKDLNMNIAPTPWGRDKYGSIIDATGERVELTGIAMATGRIRDDALCYANSALLLAAPKLLEVVQALLLTQQMRMDPREVLDENSPIMDAARDALRMLEPAAVGAGERGIEPVTPAHMRLKMEQDSPPGALGSNAGLGPTDAEVIDWLERIANEPGGLLLHSEIGPTGRTGLGLRSTGRTLRQAVAQGMGYRDWKRLA